MRWLPPPRGAMLQPDCDPGVFIHLSVPQWGCSSLVRSSASTCLNAQKGNCSPIVRKASSQFPTHDPGKGSNVQSVKAQAHTPVLLPFAHSFVACEIPEGGVRAADIRVEARIFNLMHPWSG